MKLRRIFAIVMSVLLIITMLPYISYADFSADAATSTYQDKLVNEALKYIDKKYYDVRTSMKKNGFSPLSIGAYTDKTGGDWCAWYIMACAKNAGLSTLIPAKENGARVDHLCENIVNIGGGKITFVNKTYQNKTSISCKRAEYDSNYKPRKGDIVLFGYPNTPCTHVGIITSDSSSWKSAPTVEGNTSNDSWTKSIVAKKSTGTNRGDVVPLAFVTPKYSSSSSSESTKKVDSENMRFLWPVKDHKCTGDWNEWRTKPPHVHYGLDMISTSGNTNIYAAQSGEVIYASNAGAYGNTIVIKHANNRYSLYAHLNSFKVKKGTMVTAGQRIGIMGNTGASYGVHLHFNIYTKNPLSVWGSGHGEHYNCGCSKAQKEAYAKDVTIDPQKVLVNKLCSKHTCKEKESIKKGVCDVCKTPYTSWDVQQSSENWDTSSNVVSSSNKWYKIKTGEIGVRLRLYPDENSDSARQITEGGSTEAVRIYNNQGVQVLAKKNTGWYKVKTKNGKVGYVNEKYITVCTPKEVGASTLKATLSDKTAKKLSRGKSAIVKGSVSSNYPLRQVTIKYKKGDVIKRYGKPFDNYIFSTITLNDSWEFVRDANMKNLGAGTWDIWIYAKDASNTEFEKKLGSVVISDPDVKTPTVEKTAIEGGYKIKATNNAGGDLYVSIDGKTNKSSKDTYSANITTEGKHTIKAYVWSNGKRSPNVEKTVNIGITTEPVINIVQTNGKAAVTITPADNSDTIMYKIGSTGKYQKYDGSVIEASDGIKIEAYAIGLGCYKSSVISETVDLTVPEAPEVGLLSGNSVVSQGDPVTFSWSKDSNAASYTVRLIKGDSLIQEITTETTTATFTLEEEGEYSIEVKAVNGVGTSEAATYKVSAVAPFTVTFKDADNGETAGEILQTLKVKYGEKPQKVQNPSRVGYEFVGWNSSISGDISTNAYMNIPVTEDIIYTAEYSAKTYNINFYDVDGQLLNTCSVAYGEAAPEPEVEVADGEEFVGWKVTKVSNERSRADISFVDCDMSVQAVTRWINEDIPVNIEIESANRDSNKMTIDPVMHITTNRDSAQTIYLIVSLKGEKDGVEKTLYAERQIFTIPEGQSGIDIGGGSNYSFELKTTDVDLSTVSKIEAVALDCRDDNSTGGAMSKVASLEGLDYPATYGETDLEERPEDKEGRLISEKTQYRTIGTETAHSSNDTKEGFTNTGVTEYYDASNDTWSKNPVYEYSSWASKQYTDKTIKYDEYTEVVECNETVSAYKSFAYFCDCQETWSNKSTEVCSNCKGKTKNTVVLYTEYPLSKPMTGITYKKLSNGGYRLGGKTVAKTESTSGHLGQKYVLYINGYFKDSFTTTADSIYLWEISEIKTLYRARTSRIGTLFSREIKGEWTDYEPAQGDYETRTVYSYIELDPNMGSGEITGEKRSFPDVSLGETGRIESAEDLSGKIATIMIYQSMNSDPNAYQMQYVGQTVIGDGNTVNFDYILKKDPDETTGNYIISLGVEGSTGLVTVGRVEKPKKDCYVKFYYTEEDGSDTYFVGNRDNNDGAVLVKENEDLNISKIEIPEREGYYFAGFDRRTTNISSDVSIKAVYLPVMNAMVYVDWVNRNVSIEKGLTGSKAILPGAIEDSEGYTFKGWKMPDGTIMNPGEEFSITGDMVIAAEFEQAEFNVRFIAPDGTIVDEQKVKYGEAAKPPAYSPTEGIFVSWSTDVNWWNVESDVDVYPVIVYDEEALSPKARVVVSDEGVRQVEIEFADTEVDNKIYYTTDGTVPTAELIAEYINTKPEEYVGSINEYNGPITPEEDADIMAVGFEEGKNESEVAYLYFEKEPEAVSTNDIDSPFKTATEEERKDGWIELGTFEAKVRAGKNVTVSVSLDENPGLAGYDFLVECDNGVFLADRDDYDDPIAEAGDVSANGVLNTSDTGEGYRMLWYGDEVTKDTGSLFNMTLHIDEEAEEGIYPVTVYYAPENTVDEYDEVELENVIVKVESEAAVDISTLEAKLSRDSFVYEGIAIEPAVSIQGLKEGEDYEVYYENNTDVGTAKTIIFGIGDYVGNVEKEFSITQANIVNAEISEIPVHVFTGNAIEPELDITYNGIELVKDKDYEVSYSDNKKVGTANVTIKGIGNFKGTTQAQFEIISEDEYNWGKPEYTWAETSDGFEVTGTRECLTDPSKSIKFTEKATYDVITPASCETGGLGRYTVEFTNGLLSAQTKDVAIPATGHDWGAPEYTWSEDNLKVTAVFTCENDPKHIERIDALATKEAREGGSTYTATITGPDGKSYTASKAVPTVGGGIVRIYGSSRYLTAFKNADKLKEELGVDKFKAVVVATGINFPDSLSGAYLANVKDAPILLISEKEASNVRTYINENMKPGGTIYILGGDGVVKESWLNGLNQFDIKRLAGSTRYETNLEVLKEVGYNGGDILVATGVNYPDSLAGSSVDMPILLVKGDTLTAEQSSYLKSLSNKPKCYIAGGTGVVSAKMEALLKSNGTVAKRFAGKDRYETSRMIAEEFFAKPEMVVLAVGSNFPDGLSAGPLAAKSNAPILLTDNGKKSNNSQMFTDKHNISEGMIIGGPALITDETAKAVLHNDKIVVFEQ